MLVFGPFFFFFFFFLQDASSPPKPDALSLSGTLGDSPFWRRSPAKKAAPPLPGTLTQTRVQQARPVTSSSSSSFSSVAVSSAPTVPAKATVAGTGAASSPLPRPKESAAAAPFNKEAAKRARLTGMLGEASVSLEEMCKLCWSGVPREMRGQVWRLMLGVMPAHRERRETTLARKRGEYAELVPEYEKSEARSEYESGMLRQIQRDVPRPHLQQAVWQTPVAQTALTRMLFLWSLRHPVVGFVQGFNDLASVFFALYLEEQLGDGWDDAAGLEGLSSKVLLEIEADTFWSLSKLIDGMQDVYTNERRGMLRMLDTIGLVVSKVDPALSKHFENEGIQYNTFAIPWINNLLMRAFPLELVWRLYDTYFSEGDISKFHPFVCAAFLTTFSSKLIHMDFQEAMLFIQNPPTDSWDNGEIELLLSQAFMYSSLFGGSK